MSHTLQDYRLQDNPRTDGDAAPPTVKWYATPLPRATLKALAQRNDAKAAANFALWLALVGATGWLAYLAWPTAWAIPAFSLYGVVYSSSDSRWHELSHGTPFKTRWVNEVLYHLCSFMTLREGFRWRWSHARHHTHTVIVGRDPEIHGTRPPSLFWFFMGWTYLKGGLLELQTVLHHASGHITRDAKLYVPQSEWPKMVWSCRVYVLLMAAVVAACVGLGSVLPALFIVLPRFYGGFLHFTQAITQHIGLAEDVYDHRLNARTVLMNPVFSFLYSNMNYHVEHHMYPMVPFYQLPALHELIKHDCPPPYPNLRSVYKEMLPVLFKQVHNPEVFIHRPLPTQPAS
jgi:fatty acid desaturase